MFLRKARSKDLAFKKDFLLLSVRSFDLTPIKGHGYIMMKAVRSVPLVPPQKNGVHIPTLFSPYQ